MSDNAKVVVGLLAAVTFMVAFVAVAGYFGDPPPKVKPAGNGWATVEYDGHWWVNWTSYSQGGIAHHPDCPCQRPAEAQP